jgi:hypothetical protein
MTTCAEPYPTAATVSAYERLRGGCLEARRRLAGELGLSVLLRYGMLAWIRACVPALEAKPPACVPLDTARVPSSLREDIIDVMVAMATSLARSTHTGALPA